MTSEDIPRTVTVNSDEGRSEGASSARSPASLLGGRYAILGELGRGGMGVVYRALDQRTRRVIALKTMQQPDGAALDLFKREFRYLQGVSHHNLVQLFDLESDGR